MINILVILLAVAMLLFGKLIVFPLLLPLSGLISMIAYVILGVFLVAVAFNIYTESKEMNND